MGKLFSGSFRPLHPQWSGIKDAATSKAIRQLEEATTDIKTWLANAEGSTSQFTASSPGIVPASGGGTSNFLRADGTWAPAGGGGGSGLFSHVLPSTAPTQASTGFISWLAQPAGASATDGASGVSVHCPNQSGAFNFALLTKSAPTPPYTITALVIPTSFKETADSGFSTGVIGWSNGTKLHLAYVQSANTLNVETITQPIGGTGAALKAFGWHGQYAWIQLTDDGTNVTFAASNDGENFMSMYSIAKASGYLGASGYTQIVFGTNAISRDAWNTLAAYTEA